MSASPALFLQNTPSSPWGGGLVIWGEADYLPDYISWARYPLWVDALAYCEFPLCAWLPLPAELREKLPSHYILSDRLSNHTDTLYINHQGLFIRQQLFPWQQLATYWPALVANASHIQAEAFSPLRAMAIWLGKLERGKYQPVYIPSLRDKPFPDSRDVLQSHYSPQQLRQDTCWLINEAFMLRQETTPKGNAFRRKMQKLLRDPRQFWLDSRLRKRFVK